MNTSELLTWLMDNTESVVTDSNSISVSDPSTHVDVADAHDESVYPFIGIQPISMSPVSGGLGKKNLTTTAIRTDNTDTFVGVTGTLRRDFSIEIIPVTDDDHAVRDALTDEILLYFETLVDVGDTPDDITGLSTGQSTPSGRADSFVRANGVELSGTLHTHTDTDLPAAESVNWKIDVDGNDAYPEKYP